MSTCPLSIKPASLSISSLSPLSLSFLISSTWIDREHEWLL
jgi:hypothetical protein